MTPRTTAPRSVRPANRPHSQGARSEAGRGAPDSDLRMTAALAARAWPGGGRRASVCIPEVPTGERWSREDSGGTPVPPSWMIEKHSPDAQPAGERKKSTQTRRGDSGGPVPDTPEHEDGTPHTDGDVRDGIKAHDEKEGHSHDDGHAHEEAAHDTTAGHSHDDGHAH